MKIGGERCDINVSLNAPTFEGDIILTNLRLIFKIKSEAKIQSRVITKTPKIPPFIHEYLKISLSCINKIDKSNFDKKSSKSNYIEVYTKDFRYLKLIIDNGDLCSSTYKVIFSLAFPDSDMGQDHHT